MASCFGPHAKRVILRQFLRVMTLLVIAISVTAFFLIVFGELTRPALKPPTVFELATVILVISPLWFGFHSMASRVVTPPIPPLVQVLLASIITAAFSVWVLPDILIWFLGTVLEFARQFGF